MSQSEKPQIPNDPNLAAEQTRAQKTLLEGLQTQAQADTASLMTRYGTRLALSSGGMTPAGTTPDPLSALASAIKMPDLGKLFKTGT